MRIYKISLYPIFILSFAGASIILLLFYSALNDFVSNLFLFVFGLLCSSLFIILAISLLRKRSDGKGYFWDDEGIVINLKGNKMYWNEIEKIKYSNVRGIKSTVIYPYYTNHETIRIRMKKAMPTTAHSIDWFIVEKPKEFHRELMKCFDGKSH